MTTVYATDIRKKRKVRYLGLVHYAGSEGIPEHYGHAPPPGTPYTACCGLVFDGSGETPAYIDDADIVVTCVACLGDRRGRG